MILLSNMKIGIDFDDVTIEFFDALLEWHNKKYNRSNKKEEFTEFNWGPPWQLYKEQVIGRVNQFHDSHKVEEFLPLEDAIPSLKELLKKHEVIVVTGRPLKYNSKVVDWFKHHLKRKLEIIHAGEFIKGQAATKAEICKENGISILLEDGPETALNCANSGVKVILFDNPWNKNTKHKNITHVNGWKEAMKEIKSFEEGKWKY